MRFIPPLIICLVIGIFLWQSFDIQTYQSHHIGYIKQNVSTWEQKQTFLENVEIIQSPQKEDWLIKYIDGAQKEIKIAIYMFTVPSLREALLRAKNRGVTVQVILEKNPYNAVTINRETVQFFQKNSIDFYETDNRYFSFMHAKYMIIDTNWILATANWTRSSFSSNREFFIIGTDSNILKDLENVFQTDFKGGKWISQDNRIITWPTNARERLISFIQSAKKKIDLYMPSLTDDKIILEFQKECSAGKEIYILLDDSSENVQKGNTVSKNGCPKIRMMKKPALHGKALIIDEKEAFIGSFNFTKNSLENNREMGIFLNGKTISEIVNIFEQDWQKSVAF